MKRFLKYFSLVLCLLLVVVLVGCKEKPQEDPNDNGDENKPGETVKPGDTTKPGNKQVTLTYAAWGDQTVEQKMLDAFMAAHPNIKVILDTSITGTGTAFTENLVTAAQAGILPDVFVTDNVPTVIDKGLVYDVNEFWNADDDAKKVYENIAGAALYGDKRLAVPSYQFIKGIFVNKTLLENLGIEVPSYDWTWDEFYEICQQVAEIGEYDGHPVYAINGYYGALDWEKSIAPQDDDTIGYDSWNGSKFNYLNESWIKYRKLTDVFYDSGLLEQMTPEEKEATYGAADAYPFGLGHVAFGVEGSWNAQSQVDDFELKGIDAEFYPFPAGKNGQQEPVILDFMCVSSQTSFPAEAYELLKWMSYGHDGWAARLDIMKESGKPLDRYPVAAYDDVWAELMPYMEGLSYEGMTATAKIIGNGIPDVDKWLPGYSDFWNYIAESSEEKGWYDMDVDQLAREWSTLLNQYVDEAYKKLGLSR